MAVRIDPTEKKNEIVARIVTASLCWYVMAIGGPPTPTAVPVKPEPKPASTSAVVVGVNRFVVIDTRTPSRTVVETRTASTVSEIAATTIAPRIRPGTRPISAAVTPWRSMCERSAIATLNDSGITDSDDGSRDEVRIDEQQDR